MGFLRSKKEPLPVSNTAPEPVNPNPVIRQNEPGMTEDISVSGVYTPTKKKTTTDTLMTGPSGVLGQAPIKKKTLLGM